MHTVEVALRIRLRDLRINSHLHVAHKTRYRPLHLYRYSARGVYSRTEEQVKHYVDTFGIKYVSHVAAKRPSGKTRHLTKQPAVDFESEPHLIEVRAAVDIVDKLNEQLDAQNKKRIENQFVERSYHKQIDDNQLQYYIGNRYVCEHVHAFVCDDVGIERYADHRHHA